MNKEIWFNIKTTPMPNWVEVVCRFKNGKEIRGARNNNFTVHPPKDFTADLIMSKIVEWRHLNNSETKILNQ